MMQKIRKFIFWTLLIKSPFFKTWYKGFLNEVIYDLHDADINTKELVDKYGARYKRTFNQAHPNSEMEK